MKIYTDEDIQDKVEYDVVIRGMREQFTKLANGISTVLYRNRIASGEGVLDVMGGIDEEAHMAAVKQYFYGRGLNFSITLFSTSNSDILATITGRKSTRVRTAAATALATDILARKDSRVMAIVGAGFQAQEQVRAVCQVRKVDTVIILDIDRSRSEKLAKALKEDVGGEIIQLATQDRSLLEADIIITATTSSVPVIEDRYVRPQAYINSIGSYTPGMKETETKTVCSSRTVAVDSITETANSTGEIIDAVEDGCLHIDQINEFKDLVRGNLKVRENSTTARTFFKSIGVGIEDLAVAKLIYEGYLQK